MTAFSYTVQDENGIHARPARQLRRIAKQFPGTAVTITKMKSGESASVKRLMPLMNLCVQCGDTITVVTDGPQECDAAEAVRSFLKDYL